MTHRHPKVLLLLLIVSLCVQSQTLTSLEYWFDECVDQRRSISLAGSQDEISTDIPTEGLTEGLHWLNMRAADSDGTYSGITVSPFLKFSPSAGNRVEYWFDGEYGNRRSESITVSEASSDLSIVLNMDGLSYGMHELAYRIFDLSGNVTPASTAFVLNTGKGSPDRIEYWIDDDISRSRITDSISADIDLSYVPAGMHRFNFRLCSDGKEKTGTISTDYVMVNYCEEPMMEFWLDEDTARTFFLPVSQYGSSLVANGQLAFSGDDAGFHRLFYRLSSLGHRYISTIGMSPVVIATIPDHCLQQEESEIVKGIFWIDDMPQSQFSGLQPGEVIDLEELVNMPGLPDGEHVLSMQFITSNGRRTDIDRTFFTKMHLENTESVGGILYRFYSSEGCEYASVIGYDDSIQDAFISSPVTILGNDYTVQSIEENALLGCSTIGGTARIPASVTAVGNRAFAGTPLTEVNLKAVSAPALGEDVFPDGINLRVPVAATGYDALNQYFDENRIRLTYDESCIYDSQWEALKRIDTLVREHGGYTDWDFTDRISTPSGISRWGTDNVCEIDLSEHGIGGAFASSDWTDSLPQISRVILERNSITDVTGKDDYPVLKLDSQRYEVCIDIATDHPDAEGLLSPAVPLLFRDANTGELGNPSNHHIGYGLSTLTPDGSPVSDIQEEYSFVLDVAPDGKVSLTKNGSNATNVYRGVSGQYLSVTGSGNQTITPGSCFLARLFFITGDADLDGSVSVTDLQHIINYIFGKSDMNRIFAWNAANLEEDDRINVQDVVGMVDILLNQMADAGRMAVSSPARIDSVVKDTTSEAGTVVEAKLLSEATLTFSDNILSLCCNGEVAALDLVLCSGVDCSFLTDMGMTVSRKHAADGREHIIAYSLDGTVIPAGEHTIVTSTADCNGIISASLADRNAGSIVTHIVNMPGGTTGIRVNQDDSSGILEYDLNGRAVITPYRGFIIRNGNIVLDGDFN